MKNTPHSFMDTKNLIPIGTKIRIGQNIEAIILGICIYAHAIEYQCQWWNGKEVRREWLNAVEISTSEYIPLPIGFIVKTMAS